MKNFINIFAISILISLTLYNCEVLNHNPPGFSIKFPIDRNQIKQGDTINISVEADNENVGLKQVRLYIDNAIVALFFKPPFNYRWITDCEKIGRHIVKAVVMDMDSISAEEEIEIIVNEKSETGTVTDFDGNSYRTIKIGNQWWMAENLKTTHFPDGSQINLVESLASWDTLAMTTKAFCYFNNNSNNESTTYGALYTWAAAMNGQYSTDMNPGKVQGVCPVGWHLPSDSEWKQLEIYLGMDQLEADKEGWRGTDEGSKLKDNCSGLFGYYKGANNKSGFTALPGGDHHNESFDYAGQSAYFWTATEAESWHVWLRRLYIDYATICRQHGRKDFGYSVRCVRD